MNELTTKLPEGVYDEDVVLFLKDTALDVHTLNKPRSLYHVIRIASIRDFACFFPPYQDQSVFHETETLNSFNMNDGYSRLDRDKEDEFESKYEALKEWADSMGFGLPTTLTPVCYQGSFAATVSQILKGGNIWGEIDNPWLEGITSRKVISRKDLGLHY